ncbi:MAG: hypothetical protein BWY86_01191 [Candidatus Aminicenantes bacterium ADurb.Bin508]|nr:MAG: hypothetical protein BWY86_01191 [Candidatus Aminicenantes bacterium ADurb.Bin508]
MGDDDGLEEAVLLDRIREFSKGLFGKDLTGLVGVRLQEVYIDVGHPFGGGRGVVVADKGV